MSIRPAELPLPVYRDAKKERSQENMAGWAQENLASTVWALIWNLDVELPLRALPHVGVPQGGETISHG